MKSQYTEDDDKGNLPHSGKMYCLDKVLNQYLLNSPIGESVIDYSCCYCHT